MAAALKNIAFEDFNPKIFKLWDKEWLALTSGDFAEKKFNSMTVAWGSFGIMWNKPFAMVVVRPTRHTFSFINKYDSFSLCAFPENYHEALNILGSKSGRDLDKIKAAGLTPAAMEQIAAPGFLEADLVLQCKRMYWEDLNPERFLDPAIEKNYPKKDYHRMVFGEILSIQGDEDKYSR